MSCDEHPNSNFGSKATYCLRSVKGRVQYVPDIQGKLLNNRYGRSTPVIQLNYPGICRREAGNHPKLSVLLAPVKESNARADSTGRFITTIY